MGKNFLLITLLLFISISSYSQQKKDKKKKQNQSVQVQQSQQTETETRSTIKLVGDLVEVETKGVGLTRNDALQDALRLAVEQAVGVVLMSETTVENFVVMRDAIVTRSEGYVSNYEIIREIPYPDRYEVSIKARVTTTPMKADFQLLSRAIGGVRFLVLYDDRLISSSDINMYDFAVERVNQFLSQRGYRYIERKRYDELRREAQGIMNDLKPSQETYIQYLGFKSNAQFIIFIQKIHFDSRTEAFDTRVSSKVRIECKIFDNCTSEGLGTVILESDWKSGRDANNQVLNVIAEAIEKDFTKLIDVFIRYIASWIQLGTPYELRFYHTGTYRDMRTLKAKLLNDKDFGGDIEILGFDNYMKLMITFKNKPDQLADKILDYADQIPELAQKKLDVKFIYGRQINFAPSQIIVDDKLLLSPAATKKQE